MTVLEGIKLTTEFFEKKGISEPRINAELLLAHILKCKKLDLYMAFDKPLKEDEVELYRKYLKRRAQAEPLQYIIGSVEFFGFPFVVNPSVLIPRQDTEILVETILEKFDKSNSLHFLDVGTGSGIIPIVLAKYFPHAQFYAIDISQEAITVAKENAALNNVSERVNFICMDAAYLETLDITTFDVIVSNPPYVPIEEYNKLQLEITGHEPKNAVTDNGDGLSFYKLISQKASQILGENGYLFFEIEKDKHQFVKEIMAEKNFEDITLKKDYSNIERVIYGVLNCVH
ncbi:MAG: peptide chain release factor N(5)-glutamine methyltransferase [Methanococcaceae archaeon]